MVGKVFQYLNTLFFPLIIIIFGFWYSKKRKTNLTEKAKEVVDKVEGVMAMGGQV